MTFLFNGITWMLVVATLKATILFLAAAILLYAMRSSAANARALVSLVALAGSIVVILLGSAPVPMGISLDVPVFQFAAAPSAVLPLASHSNVSLRFILLGVWAAGACFVIGRYMIGLFVMGRIVRHAKPVPGWRSMQIANITGNIPVRVANVASRSARGCCAR